MDDKKETFEYTYSAKQQEEIEKISATAQTTRLGLMTLLKRNHDLLCDIHRNC